MVYIEKKLMLSNSIGIHVKYSLLPDAEAVLFLHFSGGTLHIWDGIFPDFKEKFTIVAPDMRGHGQSDKPETGYHIDEIAQDMYLLLSELNIPRCHIIGSSMGAEIGVSLAASHPEMVASLVCEGALYNEFGEHGLFFGNDEEVEAEKSRLREMIAQRQVPVLATSDEYLGEMKVPFVEEGLWNEHFQTFLQSTMVKTSDGQYTSHYQNHVRSEYIQRYWDVRFEEYYKKIQCSVLFLPSDEEWKNEKIRASVAYFSKYLDTYEIYPVEGGVHAYVWMQKPKVASKRVLEFIEGV